MKSLEEFLFEEFTEGSAKRYLFAIQAFLNHMGEENAITSKYHHVTDYLNVLRDKGNSSAYVQTELYGIKNYYKWLLSTHQRNDNPTRNLYLKNVKGRNVQFQNLFTEAELELLLERENRYALLNWRNKLAISFYIYQGLSTGEIVNLTIHDIDLDKGTVFIKAGRNISRILPLRSKQVIFSERYLTFDRPFLIKFPTDCLFIGKLGQPEEGEGVQYLIECQRLIYPDRKLNPKTIRQSVTVNLFKKGLDIKDVQLFAGHKNPSTTEAYKPVDLRKLKEAVGKFHPLGDLV